MGIASLAYWCVVDAPRRWQMWWMLLVSIQAGRNNSFTGCPASLAVYASEKWLHLTDLNRRPSGYEPAELPLLQGAETEKPRRIAASGLEIGCASRIRTGDPRIKSAALTA